MVQKQIKGVGGVLAGILSRNEQPEEIPSKEEDTEVKADEIPVQEPTLEQVATETESPKPVKKSAPTPTIKGEVPSKKQARRGRPQLDRTKQLTEPVEREKVSLRLRSDLAATYRAWSWKEECQFSDLVDRALEFYWKSQRNARMPEKE